MIVLQSAVAGKAILKNHISPTGTKWGDEVGVFS
jgi:hypothetical protein